MNEETVVTRVLADYYDAFSTLEVHACCGTFTSRRIDWTARVFAAPTYAVLTTAFTPAMEGPAPEALVEVS